MEFYMGSTLLMIIIKILQMCIWIGFGVIIYSEMLKGKIGNIIQGKINMLSFIELTIIIFTFIYLINFILTIGLNYFF
jgi:hypothetical protein